MNEQEPDSSREEWPLTRRELLRRGGMGLGLLGLAGVLADDRRLDALDATLDATEAPDVTINPLAPARRTSHQKRSRSCTSS